jgi:predicted negative regulator of RcsB-dependent stress response
MRGQTGFVLKESTLTEYMTEQEQIEQLKAWVKQYGMTIIAGILMAVAILGIWHYWERYRTNMLTHASSIYDEMLVLRSQNEGAETSVQAEKLISHYPRTPYAKMAALMLARDSVVNRNYPEAIKQLTWVVDNSSVPSIREIAKIRIARIYLEEKKPDDAFAILKKVDSKSFTGLVDEIKGDAYLLQNDPVKAKESYQLAIQALPKEDVTQAPLLQIKLDNLSAASDTTT